MDTKEIQKRTMVLINQDVWRKAKMFVAEFGGTIQDLVSEAVEEDIRKRRKEERSKRKEAA